MIHRPIGCSRARFTSAAESLRRCRYTVRMTAVSNIAALEPVSPELVLVSPELRTAALAALWEVDEGVLDPVRRSPEFASSVATSALPAQRRSASLPLQIAGYAAWQVLTGALFGLAALAAIAAVIAALTLVAH